ncbi:MAG: 2-methyl-aconitate isomerase [Pelagibacteraceae bacterium]|nr:2-methyl-aconitate isomerase [Pelagibacteraceae bacterium]OUV89081.1 MAG: PrpF protein involved in 2-methylcitrate cycle [Pelagibacteraceae bacterium TMED146]RZO92457.1 MAG: 2-methyl-aconitate isomerase [alpha proteobacterium HIMB114]
MSQKWIKATYYRGGTSKGVFFQKKDLPTQNEKELSDIFLKVIGSPDPNERQLNGMGGGVSSVSKCVIISPSERDDADVDYNFIQIAVDQAIAEWNNNCGNLSGAVGPYAVQEGIIKAKEGENKIRIYQVNTDKIIHSTFNVKDGKPEIEGDYSIAGVYGGSSKVRLDYLEPGGSGTGKLLPTGNVIDEMNIDGFGEIKVSIVDAATPLIYIVADDLGLKGTESPDELDSNIEKMEIIQKVRRKCAVLCGLAKSEKEVAMNTPRIGIVTSSKDYISLDKSKIKADDQDITARMFSMGKTHKAIMGTAGVNIGVAAAIEGTIPNLIKKKDSNPLELRAGNPSGIMTAGAVIEQVNGKPYAKSAIMYRTFRPLMRGEVLV